MSPEQLEIALHLQALSRGDEPVSFYDAFLVIRSVRRLGGEPDEELLAAMLALHDSSAMTDGGRTVLAEYLRGIVQTQAQERSLAERILRPRDTGKAARAKAGACLRIALADAGAGNIDDWEVRELSGPAEIVPYSPAKAAEVGVAVELKLKKPGRVRLELVPRQPPRRSAATGHTTQRVPKPLVLHIIVDR